MKEEKYPHGFCRTHGQQMAPLAIAYLIERGRMKRDEAMDKINCIRLSDSEVENLDARTMAFRHMVYDGYCQDLPISWI